MTDSDDARDEEEEHGELERFSGMPEDDDTGDGLTSGAVAHGYTADNGEDGDED